MRKQSNLLEGETRCHIGVDLLGSDLPSDHLLEAVLAFSSELDANTHLVLFGTPSLFRDRHPPHLNVIFRPVEETITMEDSPLVAVRQKRNSSLCVGIRLLKEGRLQAFISAGNTGALMGCAAIELPKLPRIKKLALMVLLPTKRGEMAVLDVGANTIYKAEHLVQFAAIGVAYQKSRGIPCPRVGLLNIGSEAKKGTPELRRAYDLISFASCHKTSSFAFTGNIEGRDSFEGNIDVLVTDGFTGNVFLKTSEGIARAILEEFNELPLEKGLFSAIRKKLDYREHPGAILCGVEGIVIKCHGAAGPPSLTHSITTASRLIRHGFLETIKKELHV